MINTILLLGTLTGILLVVGFAIGGFIGTVVALVIALFINFFSYWYSDKMVLGLYRAKPLDNIKLKQMISRLAMDAKIPEPKLYIVDTEVPNAFATGRNPSNSAIAITKGLLQLTDDELEGVIAHEMAHVKNHDVLVSTLAATLGGAIAYVAHIGYWSMFFSDGRQGNNSLFGLLLIVIFAPLAAMLVRLAVSRSREYKADFTGVMLTKKPQALASALRKIESVAARHPMRGLSATSHMWIVNPFKNDWFTRLFSTHPPLGKRIQYLEKLDIKLEPHKQ
ncbi:MAG: zinc metalloprotease HtpX [Candidatus Aenigmatarchaeota archaeon]